MIKFFRDLLRGLFPYLFNDKVKNDFDIEDYYETRTRSVIKGNKYLDNHDEDYDYERAGNHEDIDHHLDREERYPAKNRKTSTNFNRYVSTLKLREEGRPKYVEEFVEERIEEENPRYSSRRYNEDRDYSPKERTRYQRTSSVRSSRYSQSPKNVVSSYQQYSVNRVSPVAENRSYISYSSNNRPNYNQGNSYNNNYSQPNNNYGYSSYNNNYRSNNGSNLRNPNNPYVVPVRSQQAPSNVNRYNPYSGNDTNSYTSNRPINASFNKRGNY